MGEHRRASAGSLRRRLFQARRSSRRRIRHARHLAPSARPEGRRAHPQSPEKQLERGGREPREGARVRTGGAGPAGRAARLGVHCQGSRSTASGRRPRRRRGAFLGQSRRRVRDRVLPDVRAFGPERERSVRRFVGLKERFLSASWLLGIHCSMPSALPLTYFVDL